MPTVSLCKHLALDNRVASSRVPLKQTRNNKIQDLSDGTAPVNRKSRKDPNEEEQALRERSSQV